MAIVLHNSPLVAQIEYSDLLRRVKETTDFWQQLALWDTQTVLYQDRIYQLRPYGVPEYDFSPYGRTYYLIADDFGRNTGAGGFTPEQAWLALPDVIGDSNV